MRGSFIIHKFLIFNLGPVLVTNAINTSPDVGFNLQQELFKLIELASHLICLYRFEDFHATRLEPCGTHIVVSVPVKC